MKNNSVLSPACGRVLEVAEAENDPGADGNFKRISIFLSLWDDHVTRSPIRGRVESALYTPGKFGIALFKKNLRKNENNLLWISDENIRLAVRQIAGRLARRVICECAVGEPVSQGQRIGVIKFGSCVQLYLPVNTEIMVRAGQKVTAGKTALACLPA